MAFDLPNLENDGNACLSASINFITGSIELEWVNSSDPDEFPPRNLKGFISFDIIKESRLIKIDYSE